MTHGFPYLCNPIKIHAPDQDKLQQINNPRAQQCLRLTIRKVLATFCWGLGVFLLLRLATSLSAHLDKIKKQYEVLQGLQEEVATSKATRPAFMCMSSYMIPNA